MTDTLCMKHTGFVSAGLLSAFLVFGLGWSSSNAVTAPFTKNSKPKPTQDTMTEVYKRELNQPAQQNFYVAGQSFQNLTEQAGMPLVIKGRPITLKQVADFIYSLETSLRGGSALTYSQVKVGEQPGFGLGNLVSNLVTNPLAGYTIFYEIEQDGRAHGN